MEKTIKSITTYSPVLECFHEGNWLSLLRKRYQGPGEERMKQITNSS